MCQLGHWQSQHLSHYNTCLSCMERRNPADLLASMSYVSTDGAVKQHAYGEIVVCNSRSVAIPFRGMSQAH